MRMKKAEQKDRHIAKLQRKRIKILRKMINSRRVEDSKLKKPKRDVIED